MPELPEVETVRRGLEELLIGKTIAAVTVYYPPLVKNVTVEAFCEALKQQTFRSIARHGKYLIFIMDNIVWLSHLRMEGRYHLRALKERTKHEHVVFTLTDGECLFYHDTRKFGTMHLFYTVDVAAIKALPPLTQVGPEPFDPLLTGETLKERIRTSKRPVKGVLLDQTIISGLGNIYVDEVCFRCKLDPQTPIDRLSVPMLSDLIAQSRAVLTAAIAAGGTTIRTFVSSKQIHGRFQNSLLVHQQKLCPNCGGLIEKIRVAGRGTFWCRVCQTIPEK